MLRGRSHRSRLARVDEKLVLPRQDVTAIDRIPVTHPARTLVDLAGSVSRSVLEEAVDDALVRRLTTLARLEERTGALGGSGRPGSALLRAVLATWSDGALPEQVAEMRLVRRLVANGLPSPVLQYVVRDGAGRVVARVTSPTPWSGSPWSSTAFAGTARRERTRATSFAGAGWRRWGWIVVTATPVDLAGDGARLAADVAAARAPVHAVGTGA